MRMPRTVLLAGGGTGGHLMPALAVAAALRQAHPDWTVHLVGARRGVEAAVLPAQGIPYTLLSSEPFYRKQIWKNLRWIPLLPRLRREVAALFEARRPDVVVGTGGYASVPVVWTAARRGIPTVLQEQNAAPGLATRLLARRAREIYLGVPEAAARLRPGPATQVITTGNPIVPPDPVRAVRARERFAVTGLRPVVVITGGSQGARAINAAVAAWLARGGGHDLDLLWITGPGSYQDYASWHRPPAVQVIGFLDPMADAWAIADLVVCRAGMMTLAEIAAWGIPSILIPLPAAAQDHQTANARVMAEAGASVLLPQGELTPERLEAEIAAILTDAARRRAMEAAARVRGRPDAVRRILRQIEALVLPTPALPTS